MSLYETQPWRRGRRARYNKKYYGATTNSARGGQEWTPLEDNLVRAHRIPDRELAKQLERSVGSIQKRRWVIRDRDKEEA